MKKLILLLVFILFVPLSAQEAITLTTPIVPTTISNYTPQALSITVVPPRITIQILATDGHIEIFNYPCVSPCAFTTDAQVLTLITTLNTANLATRSLWRRVFDRLLLDFPTRFSGGATVN